MNLKANFDNNFFDTKMNLPLNSGLSNKGITLQCGARSRISFEKKTYVVENLLKKKPFAVYIRVPKALGTKIGGNHLECEAFFFFQKKIDLTNTVRKTEIQMEIQTKNSDGAGRQCMRGKLIPHHGAGD